MVNNEIIVFLCRQYQTDALMNGFKHKYLLDTNFFDYVLDHDIAIYEFSELGEYYTSNVQYSELQNLQNQSRKKRLLEIYRALPQTKLPIQSGIWLDDLHWDDDELWNDEVGDLIILFTDSSTSKPWKDALIAEIAKYEELTIITNDKKFTSRARKIGINVISAMTFFKHCI